MSHGFEQGDKPSKIVPKIFVDLFVNFSHGLTTLRAHPFLLAQAALHHLGCRYGAASDIYLWEDPACPVLSPAGPHGGMPDYCGGSDTDGRRKRRPGRAERGNGSPGGEVREEDV